MKIPDDLVERVAAICEELFAPEDADVQHGIAAQMAARAAIIETLRGIREPSDQMREAQMRAIYGGYGEWQAMLDQLIKEIEAGTWVIFHD